MDHIHKAKAEQARTKVCFFPLSHRFISLAYSEICFHRSLLTKWRRGGPPTRRLVSVVQVESPRSDRLSLLSPTRERSRSRLVCRKANFRGWDCGLFRLSTGIWVHIVALSPLVLNCYCVSCLAPGLSGTICGSSMSLRIARLQNFKVACQTKQDER